MPKMILNIPVELDVLIAIQKIKNKDKTKQQTIIKELQKTLKRRKL